MYPTVRSESLKSLGLDMYSSLHDSNKVLVVDGHSRLSTEEHCRRTGICAFNSLALSPRLSFYHDTHTPLYQRLVSTSVEVNNQYLPVSVNYLGIDILWSLQSRSSIRFPKDTIVVDSQVLNTSPTSPTGSLNLWSHLRLCSPSLSATPTLIQ